MKAWLLGFSVAAVLLASAGALAQENHWSDGDVELVPVHPDLAFEDGAVRSSGDFLAQTVIRGEDADRVAEVSFSFGVGPPSPVYHPGYVGLWDYRVDDTADDGWFVPLTTEDTPDGEYKFAVHAYASAGDPTSEVARLWGTGVVDNGGGDAVGPWPWILPGETEQTTNPHGARGVTIEFAENATAELFVDGEQVELQEWTPPERDDDDIPRHTEETRVLGDGYRWDGDVQRGTVLRVDATDEAGNEVTKGALVGHGIDNPVIEVRLAEVPQLEAGEEATVSLEVANIGLRAGEAGLEAVTPRGWNASVTRPPGVLEPGATTTVPLNLDVPASADVERGEIGVEATYSLGEENVTSTFVQALGEEETSRSGTDAGIGQEGGADGEDLQQQADVRGDEDGIPLGPAAGLLALAAAGSILEGRRPDR